MAVYHENTDLGKKLIKVLREEENLSLNSQADFKTPFIRKNYFHELYQSERGKALMKFGAQIEESNSDEEVKQSSTTDIE